MEILKQIKNWNRNALGISFYYNNLIIAKQPEREHRKKTYIIEKSKRKNGHAPK